MLNILHLLFIYESDDEGKDQTRDSGESGPEWVYSFKTKQKQTEFK